MSAPRPPVDGHPLPVDLKLRQHEVQVVAGLGGCLAAAWTDDTKMNGMDGWTCGFSVTTDNGKSWSAPLFHKNLDFDATANPTIAVDRKGMVFAVAMSVAEDYTHGVLELASSSDYGRSWSAWETIASKHDGIPDRPKLIAAAKGDLHLVFSGVERTGRRIKALKSTILLIRSTDRGHTWSDPRMISEGERRSKWLVDGYQGPAIAEVPDGNLLASWADYYGNGVSFSMSRNGGIDFAPPVWVKLKALPGRGFLGLLLGATFGAPVTELAVDATGRNLVISVHEAHTTGYVALVGSHDAGKTWRRLGQPSLCGTNVSLKFDSTGRLHILWTELVNERVDILYALSNDYGRTFNPPISLAGGGAAVVAPETPAEWEEYVLALGSYQSLVIGEDGTASAFWVDLRAGLRTPKLYYSNWEV